MSRHPAASRCLYGKLSFEHHPVCRVSCAQRGCPPPTSSSRMRGSKVAKDGQSSAWVPAFAGMTECVCTGGVLNSAVTRHQILQTTAIASFEFRFTRRAP